MKAVVLETRGREAAVLAKDGTVRIVRGRYSVGDIIEYGATVRQTVVRWAAAAAAMALLLGGSAAMWVDRNCVACAEVSLDVNPSIVFTVNKRDRVLTVRAVNADAEGIVDSLEQEGVRFVRLTDAVEHTMALLEDEGYLDAQTEDYVLLNVSADDDVRQERLSGEVESAMTRTMERDATLEYRIDRSDRETARRAAENGMSTGRYALWEQAGEARDGGEPPKKETYSDMPVRDMIGDGKENGSDTGRARPEAGDAQPEEARGQDVSAEDHGAKPEESDRVDHSQPAPERGEQAPETAQPQAGAKQKEKEPGGGKQASEAAQPQAGASQGEQGPGSEGSDPATGAGSRQPGEETPAGKQDESSRPSGGEKRDSDSGGGSGGQKAGSDRQGGSPGRGDRGGDGPGGGR